MLRANSPENKRFYAHNRIWRAQCWRHNPNDSEHPPTVWQIEAVRLSSDASALRGSLVDEKPNLHRIHRTWRHKCIHHYVFDGFWIAVILFFCWLVVPWSLLKTCGSLKISCLNCSDPKIQNFYLYKCSKITLVKRRRKANLNCVYPNWNLNLTDNVSN